MSAQPRRDSVRVETDDEIVRGDVTATTTTTGYDLPGGPEGLGSLISGVIKDLQELVRDEVQLAKVEIKEDIAEITKAAGMFIAGAVLGLVGLIIFMIGVADLLAEWMDGWLAAGIVGLVLLAIAAILAIVGKNKISAANLKPQQTIDSLKEDQAWAKRQMNSVKK